MEKRASNTGIARSTLIGMVSIVVLALAGCGGDSGPAYDPNCPLCEPEDFEDHILQSCQIHYEWNGLFYYWTNCETGWTPVANQPVFTSLNDCSIAKGHLLDENDAYWDNSQEDKDRGFAWELFCFAATSSQ